MAGIYFHIPFCKQACHYCDFHFSTSLQYKGDLLKAMQKELEMRKEYLSGQTIESIYFGGGTPSLLNETEISRLIDGVGKYHTISSDVEITLEANPDDLNSAKVADFRKTAINRFSIGIQSFFEEDLKWMNRAHNASEAESAIKRVQDAGFENITADLIYGFPLLSDQKWESNIRQLVSMGIPHISAYSMTVEPQTALGAYVRKGKESPMDDDQSAMQFEYLMDRLVEAKFAHYEISNWAKPGSEAIHNSNYWKGQPYLGVGPSAHSYNGDHRQWNINNNARYIQSIAEKDVIPFQRETLSEEDRINEYIMTSLRTSYGLDLAWVKNRFGESISNQLAEDLAVFDSQDLVFRIEDRFVLTRGGKLLADRIASDLFV